MLCLMTRHMLPKPPPPDLHQAIRALLLAARAQVRQTVNTAMVQTYWHIGRMIVEDEQGGQKRAAYGKQVLPELAKRLSGEFGAGFDVSNLRNMRRLFLAFPIRETLSLELSWSAYLCLIRIDNPQARDWYAKEAPPPTRATSSATPMCWSSWAHPPCPPFTKKTWSKASWTSCRPFCWSWAKALRLSQAAAFNRYPSKAPEAGRPQPTLR